MSQISEAARVRIAIDEDNTDDLQIVTITRVDMEINDDPAQFTIVGRWELNGEAVRCYAVDSRDAKTAIFDLVLEQAAVPGFTEEAATAIAIEGARVFLEVILPSKLGHPIQAGPERPYAAPRRRRWWRR